MTPRFDIVYYWFTDIDPAENDKESLQKAGCPCSWCCESNLRAIDEYLYGTPHLLDYWNDRGLLLKQGVCVSNCHILAACEILHTSYRKVLQPVRLECLAGTKVKNCVGFQGLEELSKIIPEPIHNSLFDYVSDSMHMFGNYAKLHDDLPEQNLMLFLYCKDMSKNTLSLNIHTLQYIKTVDGFHELCLIPSIIR